MLKPLRFGRSVAALCHIPKYEPKQSSGIVGCAPAYILAIPPSSASQRDLYQLHPSSHTEPLSVEQSPHSRQRTPSCLCQRTPNTPASESSSPPHSSQGLSSKTRNPPPRMDSEGPNSNSKTLNLSSLS